MASMELLVVIIIILLFSLLIGTPVSSALGVTALAIMLLFMAPVHLTRFGVVAYAQGTSMNQMVAPLFIIMAEFLAQGGVAADIYEFMNRMTRRLRGGLALSTTLACTIFAALCGSSPATAASIGRISINQMTKRGYDPSMAAGTVTAAGTLGIMIPPSLTFVLYGIITETSIAKLLMAGLLPGLMLSALLCVSILIRVNINPALAGERRKTSSQPPVAAENIEPEIIEADKSFASTLLAAVPALILIVLVLGALYSGIATPTESAGVGAIGAFVIVILKRKVTPSFLKNAFSASARTTSMMIMMMIAGLTLSYVISYMGIARQIATFIVGSGVNRWVVMAMLIILWYIMGCLLDPGSMVVLTIPFIYPALLDMGFDPIWLGVVSTLCVEVGMITPPVGLNLFIMRSVTDLPMNQIIKGSLPYVLVLTIGLVILCIFPDIALFLPSHM